MTMAAGSKLMKPFTSDEPPRPRRKVWKRVILNLACCCKSRDVDDDMTSYESLTSYSARLPSLHSSFTSQLQGALSHSTVSLCETKTKISSISSFHRKDGDHMPRSPANICSEETEFQPCFPAILTSGKFSNFHTSRSLDYTKRHQNNTKQQRQQTMSLQISAPMALSSLDILMMMINQPSFDRPFLNVTKEASTPPCTKPMCGIVDTDPADITVSQPISDVTLHYLSPGECPFNVELLQRHSSTTMTSSFDTIHQATLMLPQRAFGTSTDRIFNSMISVRVESDVKDCNYPLARTQSCGEFRFSSITLPANAGHMTSSIHDPCRFVHGCHDTIPEVTFNVTVSAQHQVSATPMYKVMTHQPHCYMSPRSRHSYSVPVSFQLATFSVIINRKCFSLSALIVRSSSRRLRQPSVSALFKHSSNATMSYEVQNTSTKATVSDHCGTPVTAFAASSTTEVRSLVNEGPSAAEQKSSIVPWLSTTEPIGGTNDSGGFQRCDFNTFQPITGTGQVKPRHGYAANRNVNAQSENQSKCLRSTETFVQTDSNFTLLDGVVCEYAINAYPLATDTQALDSNNNYQLFGNATEIHNSQPTNHGYAAIGGNQYATFDDSNQYGYTSYMNGCDATANWGPNSQCNQGYQYPWPYENQGLDSTGRLLQAPSNRWEVGAAVGGDSDGIFGGYFPSQENHGPNWNNDFHDDRLAVVQSSQTVGWDVPSFDQDFHHAEKTVINQSTSPKDSAESKVKPCSSKSDDHISKTKNHLSDNAVKQTKNTSSGIKTSDKLLSHIKGNQTPSAKLRLPCKTIEWSDLVDVLDKFKKPKTLGGGVYARVRLMKIISTDQMCAVKLPREELEEEDVSQVLETEINSLAALNGLDCVPQLYGVSKTEAGVPFLVQEFIGDPSKLRCTTLENAIGAKVLDITKTLRIALRIIRAVKEIYNRRVLHCDLKVDNVMLMPGFVRDDDPKITLIDFGRAVSLNQPPVFEHLGTLEQQDVLEHCGQMAPEVVKGESPYGLCSEVYSLGLIFKEMGCRFDGFLTQLGRECMKRKPSLRPDLDELVHRIENYIKDNQL